MPGGKENGTSKQPDRHAKEYNTPNSPSTEAFARFMNKLNKRHCATQDDSNVALKKKMKFKDEVKEEITRLNCKTCGSRECEWDVYGPKFIKFQEDNFPLVEGDIGNNSKRKELYQELSRLKYGYLGRHNRRSHSACAVNGIRNMFPDANNDYMGYKES